MGLFSLFVWQPWLLLSLRQRQILLTSMVVCMDIMDMPDTHTPMVTMDTMESVKLKQSLKLIPFIYMVVCMDIMDMLDTLTPMVTMDTMESVKLMPMLIQFCSMVDMDTMDMLDTMDTLDTPMYTMDRYQHQQMNLTQNMDTNHSLLSSSVTFIFQCLTVIQ